MCEKLANEIASLIDDSIVKSNNSGYAVLTGFNSSISLNNSTKIVIIRSPYFASLSRKIEHLISDPWTTQTVDI